jgi:hypothetical protein
MNILKVFYAIKVLHEPDSRLCKVHKMQLLLSTSVNANLLYASIVKGCSWFEQIFSPSALFIRLA